ncbi:glycine betaine ABC transporter substrate-binding protein [Clostridium gasigenes]|uniref:Glycine betaine/proline transport system substrate-binding protein n=1 Tax=Clostridium gasigenes TaxID=94869 RepID=A0A1H0LQZ3_9CLOT|nr:glycine betaine ABC transporter substrate-binding protein [Clostridium gasigenes]MBB6622412.1 glycine/betaine ABC transporter [Clostridium gasigenes]MBB6713922.1 glycine/betaine ABC transporter [Clostridium gasigenes]MBU3087183.1 glycine/betaine ABC transporter [Clostridium gasigenes]SDO70503.1 glycine betaine/proline transport system substrate-binding protein [Clostridium gasigenes]
MIKKNWKIISVVAISIVALTFVGCSNSKSSEEKKGADATYGEKVKYKITGIDAGAGVVQAAEKAVKDYKLDYTVQTSSGGAMTQALADAIKNKEPIIITGWSPHWMFSKYDLKYLDDPKGSFGGNEHINTIARNGLKEDMPNAHKILDQFLWTADDMEAVMLKVNEGENVKEVARQWITDNTDKVSKWTEGAKKVDGEEIKLAYVAWDTEIASTNIIGLALEDMGYKVTLTQVDAGPMWAAVASGDVDAIVAAWLPGTHAKYISDYEGKVEDLGPNLEGAKIGLVVPSYMDINSIEDLVK